MLDDAREEVLAHTRLPLEHWRKTRTNNPMENLNAQIKRRSHVVGIFPKHGFFRIAPAEEGVPMTVSVFDLAGRMVWNGASSSGDVLWNKCTTTGTPVPTGLYLLLIESDGLDPVTSKIVVR